MKKLLDAVCWGIVGAVLLALAVGYVWMVVAAVQYSLTGDARGYVILSMLVGVPVICLAIGWLTHRGQIR